jgi:L-ascorbate metabolism protein UlaG (beta-lactamase superfamily)
MNDSVLNKIKWLGHDSFRIEAEKVIYIDPFQIKTGPKADIILITHEHYDHCSPEDVEKIRAEDTIIVTEKNSAQKLSGNIKIMKPGDTATVAGIKIETVPAYNLNKKFHPKANGWLGFIIEIDGQRIYHAGDADFIPEMSEIQADIAMLPVSGTYVMTAEEAVTAALALRPGTAIPMHYGSIIGSEEDARRFEKELAGRVSVKVLAKV